MFALPLETYIYGVTKLLKKIAIGFLVCFLLLISYILWNIILYQGLAIPFGSVDNNDEIVKRAVRKIDLTGEKYIVGKYVAITGYNYRLVRNEEGMFSRKLVRVTGLGILPEHEVNYDFLTAGNSFVLYVTEKKEYYDEELGEKIVEYVVCGWNVLYPVKHDSPITTLPCYILKSDFYDY